MKILIVGAGNVGYYLTRSLLVSGSHHDIRIVEKDKARCVLCADRLEVPVIHGDGSKISTLEKVGAGKMDLIVAVTGRDEDNCIAAQLAKQHFHVKTAIVKANNPKNVEIIKKIAADIVISSANMLANIIEQEVDAISMRAVTRMTMGDAAIMEFIVSEEDDLAGKRLMDIKWPNESLVIAVIRNGKSIIPSGDTQLLADDDVLISTKEANKKQFAKLFAKRKHY